MIDVYVSHLGEVSVRAMPQPVRCLPGNLSEVIDQVNVLYPGFRDLVAEGEPPRLRSSVLVFGGIELDDDRWLEGPETRSVSSLQESLVDCTTLLIALFNPERLMTVLTDVLTASDRRFYHASGQSSYRAFMSGPTDSLGNQPLWVRADPEPVYPFHNGRLISELVTDGALSVAQNKLVPALLRNAVAKIWELDDDFRLRLFQEDALFHIMRELRRSEPRKARPLLLSIPTGGGKTEAFLIPLIAHLFDLRREGLIQGQVPANACRILIIYPTRALANDQAKRLAEILYALNHGAMEAHHVSIGVLTGDTPSSGNSLMTEKSLLQVCPACNSVITDFPNRTLPDGSIRSYARCLCGVEIGFFRLTRPDILDAPPDILITSPDMINRTLQSPRYHRRLFTAAIEAVVLDEIHMYDGVFGCNVAHLLRRFEEACGRGAPSGIHYPLYVGVSATIRNAKALASLIFDASLGDVCYLRPARPGSAISAEERPYINYDASPARFRHHYAVAPIQFKPGRFQNTVTASLNIADALGHFVGDPHFRKTLIFSNFRQDTDDLVRFFRNQEALYYQPYLERILPRLLISLQTTGSTESVDLTQAEVDVARAIDHWARVALDDGVLYRSPLQIGWHRGGLEKEERIKAVNRFTAARRLSGSDSDDSQWPIDIMVATNTLELGIDIGDVTTVINNTSPLSVNEYTQRVGRGGRRRDSLALTIVNPTNPLDFYALRHFDRYVHPTADDFEDAPIIISNHDVLRSHVLARLLDHLAWYWNEPKKDDLQVVDLKGFRLTVEGSPLGLEANPEGLARALFNTVLPPPTLLRLQNWIAREACVIPGIQPTKVEPEELSGWWQNKFRQLYERICTSKRDLADTDYLSGMPAKDRDLVPDMRSAGPQVGLYLVREGGEDELRDTVSRSQAIYSRPKGGFASQGSVTYRIEDLKARDVEAETRFKELLATHSAGRDAIAYFHRMFGDEHTGSPFPNDPLQVLIRVDIQTPQDMSVKYHPYRFYCPRCGATYSDKRAGDERCSYCGAELRQLTEVYICGGCGKVYMPPVPKVCINPACVAKAKHHRDGTPFVDAVKKIGKYDRHNDYFRFTALPRLKWQCRTCGTEVNYHAFYELPGIVKAQLEGADWKMDTPAGIARNFLYFPEAYFHKGYDAQGWHRPTFYCKSCRDAHQYSKIHVVNIPAHRSVVHEYLIKNEAYAPPLQHSLGCWTFPRVSVLSLAREQYRRFFKYPEQDTIIFPGIIFPESNSYLGNAYDSHAAFLQLSPAIDAFLDRHPSALDFIRGDDGVCTGQPPVGTEDEADQDVEASDLTSPLPALLPWERNRKPDPRRMWCGIVRGEVADRMCQDDACTYCRLNAFDRRAFARYLVLHTLKHTLINALPRFTGADKNQVRGYLYPNDQREYDLALVDRIVGGSGCLYLLRTNWGAIWEMMGELLDAAQHDGGQLLLPYTCSRYNRDICASLAHAFYRFLEAAQD